MKLLPLILQGSLMGVMLLSMTMPVSAKGTGYKTGFDRWRAAEGGFTGWDLSGVATNGFGQLVIGSGALTEQDPFPAGGYNGISFYNGGSYLVGEATSPWVDVDFSFTEAIASWNVDTPAGTWVEVLIQARMNGVETKFYNLGVWASGSETIQRHSVNLQGDTNGYVATDTLVLTAKKAEVDGYRLKVRLFQAGTTDTPVVRNLSVAYSTAASKKATLMAGDSSQWGTLLPVPECSQMVYPNGGNVWCSPTSVSMVLGYLGSLEGTCENRVFTTRDGVYDAVYDGHGNWPFNTAYAASLGNEAYVVRFDSMAKLEPWVKAGVPVIISFGWGKDDLTGAAVDSSAGHLAVLVGFDANGNPIVNDPAAGSDEDVQRTYLRSELETLWLTRSGGTVYLIYPIGATVPGL